MKIWQGYGTEHSSNLIMIGRFKDAEDAARAKDIIENLIEQVRADEHDGLLILGECSDRYTTGMLELLRKLRVHSVGPDELQQFALDVDMKVKPEKKNELVLTTEEIDISAFLKVLIDTGARVEVYSAHDYPDTDYGRGK
ncbi:MAG: DUF6375 family protein [Syntrophobacteraceae bacterium]